MDNFPYANGIYTQDDSLTDCDNIGYPRYQQNGGTGFLWYDIKWYRQGNLVHFDAYWRGTSVLCDASLSVEQFFAGNTNMMTPDQVPAGEWEMMHKSRTGWQFWSALTVTQCGKPQINCGVSQHYYWLQW